MKYLTRLFKEEVDNRKVKFHPLYEAWKIVSLCFADELIVLCDANEDTLLTITEKLKEFGDTAGLYSN